MEDLDIKRWVLPFYLDFLHANFVRIGKTYSVTSPHQRSWDEWSMLLRHELDAVTPEIVGDLIMDVDWRTQICGAYFCGLNRWNHFTLDIGRRLVAKRNGFATQGYAFALARMPSHASANYLCGYLSRVGRLEDTTSWYEGDLEWVIAALQWVDAHMNTNRLEPYIGRLIPFWQKHRFQRLTRQYRDIPSYLKYRNTAPGLPTDDPRVVEMELRLTHLEKQLDFYFVPCERQFKNEWFQNLMAFCEEHFDSAR